MSNVTTSFTERAWVYALNFLYPSEVQEVQSFEDKGSIKKSIDIENLKIEKLTCKSGWTFKIIEATSAIGRQVTFWAIATFFSPMGALYHGKAALQCYAQGKKDLAKRHVSALMIDGFIGLSAAASVFSLWQVFFSKKPKVTWVTHMNQSNILAYRYVGYLGVIFSSIHSWDVLLFASLFERTREHSLLRVILLLKRKYGVVSKEGFFLSYSVSEDRETEQNGIFYQLEKKSLTKLSEIIDKVCDIPQTSEEDRNFLKNQKANYLNGNRGDWVNRGVFYLSIDARMLNIDAKKTASELRATFMDAYNTSLVISKFRFQVARNSNQVARNSNSWQIYQKSILDDLPSTPEGIPQEVSDFESRLKECLSNPIHLLNPQGEETIMDAYHRLSSAIYPLKENPDTEKYSTALFNCLKMAKDLLIFSPIL